MSMSFAKEFENAQKPTNCLRVESGDNGSGCYKSFVGFPYGKGEKCRFGGRKFYLCGLCPYELFDQTKSDVGPHREGSEHDLRCKQEWESLTDEERKEYGYEYDLLEWLEELVKQCDERIEATRKRLKEKQEEKPPEKKLNEEEQEKVLKLTAQMDELIAEAEKLGEAGEVDKSLAVTEQVNSLKKQITDITQPIPLPLSNDRLMVVCEVSGNLLCSTDTEDRKARHYAGRHYQGWIKAREKLKELRERVGPRPADWKPKRRKEFDRKRQDRDRDRDGDRKRDRDRDGEEGEEYVTAIETEISDAEDETEVIQGKEEEGNQDQEIDLEIEEDDAKIQDLPSEH
eukprot:CAMPEP_0167746070 /NCGR_PEP_ID=MMETSP0110_2-20121227/3505_1 /TAXON_ID=629695 /ORGANISM="Gymnochlora sp., Strain CCMP2014" /LENGTH=342 /DNA_ID=CAMNT_0007630787 /DNA_START=995 /DNA_END=2025 /DNA_ORIENTATION=+